MSAAICSNGFGFGVCIPYAPKNVGFPIANYFGCLGPSCVDTLYSLVFLTYLCTRALAQARWCSFGLPSDRVSLENGAVMTVSERWCLNLGSGHGFGP